MVIPRTIISSSRKDGVFPWFSELLPNTDERNLYPLTDIKSDVLNIKAKIVVKNRDFKKR